MTKTATVRKQDWAFEVARNPNNYSGRQLFRAHSDLFALADSPTDPRSVEAQAARDVIWKVYQKFYG